MPCDQAFALRSYKYIRAIRKRQGQSSTNKGLPSHCPILPMPVYVYAYFFLGCLLGRALCSAEDTLLWIMGARRVGDVRMMVNRRHQNYVWRLLGTGRQETCAREGIPVTTMDKVRSLRWVSFESTGDEMRYLVATVHGAATLDDVQQEVLVRPSIP